VGRYHLVADLLNLVDAAGVGHGVVKASVGAERVSPSVGGVGAEVDRAESRATVAGDSSRATMSGRSGQEATGDGVEEDGDTEGGGALGREGGVGSGGGAQTGREAAFVAAVAAELARASLGRFQPLSF